MAKGEFLTDFKKSKIIPIFKKGCPTDINNFRAINLLPVMSKILEKLIYVRLISFLNQQKFFNAHQFGFRKNHSSSHASILLIEEITKAFKSKQHVLGIFLDLSKAFDTIDHGILLNKLYHYGIRGLAHDWFSSYLSNRTQQVEILNTLSDSKKIESGVPQGSILGPLLFLIYVNDFTNSLTAGKSIMFADDTNVFFSSDSYQTLYATANNELKNINNWLIANKLSLNVGKTKHVIFRTPNTKPPSTHFQLLLRNFPVDRESTIKFLGLIIHENLSWKPHMEYLLRKLRISYGVIRKASSFLNTRALLMLYYSLIQSHLTYCICTWCNGNKTTTLELQRVANKFIRMIYNLDNRTSVKAVMQQNGILSIDQLLKLETACFMFKYIKDLLPLAFSNLLRENLIQQNTSLLSPRRTRSNSKFFPTYCRTNVTKQSLKFKGPAVWGTIPSQIKDLQSYHKFRKELKISFCDTKLSH